MAKSTFIELVNRMIQESGISGGDIASVTNQTGIRKKAVDWVASSDIYIQRIYLDWNFLHKGYSESTILNTKDYVKPSDLSLWDKSSFYLDYSTDSYVLLHERDYIEWRNSLGVGVQTADQPANVVFKPNKDIILFPMPDGVYALTADYWKTPTKMTANSSTSDIPETFEDVIVHRAKMLYAQHEEAPDMLAVATEEYDLALNDLMSSEAPNHEAKNLASINEVVQVF